MQAINQAATKTLETLVAGMKGDHLSIENEPYTRLVIEKIGKVTGVGLDGGELISIAHYPTVEPFEDALVDPEVCLIRCLWPKMNKKTYEFTNEIQYFPYYIKYLTGKEFTYVRFEDDDFTHAKQYTYAFFTQKGLAEFVGLWCKNIKLQGFLEAMQAQNKPTKEVSVKAFMEPIKAPLIEAGLLREEKDGSFTAPLPTVLKLDYAKMDYLNCLECPIISMQHPGSDQGECSEPKEGCKTLLAMLARDTLARISVSMEA
jgi:hypothetical protein